MFCAEVGKTQRITADTPRFFALGFLVSAQIPLAIWDITNVVLSNCLQIAGLLHHAELLRRPLERSKTPCQMYNLCRGEP